MNYHIMFETDSGMAMLTMTAKNRRAAIEELKRRHPEHIGSDGVIENENGDEFPLNW